MLSPTGLGSHVALPLSGLRGYRARSGCAACAGKWGRATSESGWRGGHHSGPGNSSSPTALALPAWLGRLALCREQDGCDRLVVQISCPVTPSLVPSVFSGHLLPVGLGARGPSGHPGTAESRRPEGPDLHPDRHHEPRDTEAQGTARDGPLVVPGGRVVTSGGAELGWAGVPSAGRLACWGAEGQRG